MATASQTDQSEDVHVVPLNDKQEHVLSYRCWCSPEFDNEDGRVFVHNSADGREWGELIPKERWN